MWLLMRDGRSAATYKNYMRDGSGAVMLFTTEDAADASRSKQIAIGAYQQWRVKKADSDDFAAIHKCKSIPEYKRVACYPKETKEMATKTTSSALLVDVFEDYESRRFAIASRAATEEEFIAELAQAMTSQPTSDWPLRLRELLPLCVDMCCRYRGYKADTVKERRELIAGDMEMPHSTK